MNEPNPIIMGFVLMILIIICAYCADMVIKFVDAHLLIQPDTNRFHQECVGQCTANNMIPGNNETCYC